MNFFCEIFQKPSPMPELAPMIKTVFPFKFVGVCFLFDINTTIPMVTAPIITEMHNIFRVITNCIYLV